MEQSQESQQSRIFRSRAETQDDEPSVLLKGCEGKNRNVHPSTPTGRRVMNVGSQLRDRTVQNGWHRNPAHLDVDSTRDRTHLRRGGPLGSPAVAGPRRVFRGGAAPRFGTPAGFPAYSPGLAHQPGPYGGGAGRSARGLPILWESPSAEDLRGRLWQQSPGAVRSAGAQGKRRRSGLADEGLAKRR